MYLGLNLYRWILLLVEIENKGKIIFVWFMVGFNFMDLNIIFFFYVKKKGMWFIFLEVEGCNC